ALNTVINANLGSGVNPDFSLRRTTPTTNVLFTSPLEIIDVAIVLLLTLRTVVSKGNLTISGDFPLNAGDTIVLTYTADGLTYTLNFSNPGTTLNIYRIR
ncbi:collagen-like protein, partial [Candidatus Saccharibacteria bacterium]|nr:collagen-like protein [Candidatus Saccharibacteria bacterium]